MTNKELIADFVSKGLKYGGPVQGADVAIEGGFAPWAPEFPKWQFYELAPLGLLKTALEEQGMKAVTYWMIDDNEPFEAYPYICNKQGKKKFFKKFLGKSICSVAKPPKWTIDAKKFPATEGILYNIAECGYNKFEIQNFADFSVATALEICTELEDKLGMSLLPDAVLYETELIKNGAKDKALETAMAEKELVNNVLGLKGNKTAFKLPCVFCGNVSSISGNHYENKLQFQCSPKLKQLNVHTTSDGTEKTGGCGGVYFVPIEDGLPDFYSTYTTIKFNGTKKKVVAPEHTIIQPRFKMALGWLPNWDVSKVQVYSCDESTNLVKSTKMLHEKFGAGKQPALFFSQKCTNEGLPALDSEIDTALAEPSTEGEWWKWVSKKC